MELYLSNRLIYTGADTERSGTGWDEIYYGEMQDLNIAGKKVAVFGLGDSVSYTENYADASGEVSRI
jgi:flavodoxin I